MIITEIQSDKRPTITDWRTRILYYRARNSQRGSIAAYLAWSAASEAAAQADDEELALWLLLQQANTGIALGTRLNNPRLVETWKAKLLVIEDRLQEVVRA